ncbi:MAG: hypothetical protein WA584_01660 [Pyrinomonadaceae bacterium]
MSATQMNLSSGTLILTTDSTVSGGLEPSGLADYNDLMYIASDNGLIDSMNIDGTSLTNVYKNASTKGYGDFESITVNGDMLLVGVEGGNKDGSPTYAKVQQLVTSSNTLSGYNWKLNDPKPDNNAGMEALAYYSGNIYLTSFQCKKGDIYVYSLTSSNSGGGVDKQSKFSLPSPKSGNTYGLSDLYWHSGRQKLYALYDSGDHWLQELTLSVSKNVYSAKQTKLWLTPQYQGSSADWEACTFIGDDLYLGLDRKDCTANVVYKFANFS